MAREYFPKYSEIPKDVFKQVKAKLEGYDRLKKERLDIVYGTSPKEDGMPRGSEVGNPTEYRATRLAYINGTLEAIDQSSVWMRGKYAGEVQDDFDPVKAFWSYDYFNCQHIRDEEHSDGPAYRTWLRYRFAYAALVAKRLHIF